MSVVTMKQLLEAGVHFGHQTHKWNPKMKKYIFIKRNGIHILDLKQTVDAVNEAYVFVREVASRGDYILFVGTKKQAQDAIETAAKKCAAFFVNNRWYGGMLTNMTTIRRSVEKMEYFEQIQVDGTISNYTKLEATRIRHRHDKIEKALGGIRGMNHLPGAVFIVDTETEAIAVHEARKLGVPIVGMVDTNCDPDLVDYVIPSNDDAIRAIYLIADIMAKAVTDGRQALTEGAATVDATADENLEAAMTEAPADVKSEEPKPKPQAPKAEAEPQAEEPSAPATE
jgi:small subunit ribosomal protein S2